MNKNQVSFIGAGRWGGFLAYYLAVYKNCDVSIYDRSENYKNEYLTFPENVKFYKDFDTILSNDLIIISIPCQQLRSVARELNKYDLNGKTFLLAMKGLEETSGKRLSVVMSEEINQDIRVAVLLGPGHVQDYLKKIPSCAVVDSSDNQTKEELANFLNSDLIRTYIGTDLIGNEIGGALKNVIGIAAGILDGLNYSGLKGALMARAPVEVGRLIEHNGGDKMSAYGLCHLGDYEATLFSPHSHNRRFGEDFIQGKKFEKLAEGVATLKSIHLLKDKISMPICESIYEIIYNQADTKKELEKLFSRPIKKEF